MNRPNVPVSLAERPWDEKLNLPIPVVSEFDTGHNFAAINGDKSLEMGRHRLCALCGKFMQYWVAFLGGPRSAQQGTYSDGPMHPACAEAATRLCPHIALSRHRRASDARMARMGEVLEDVITVPEGFEEDKPDTWVMYVTRQYEVKLVPGAGGGLTAVYFAAPAKSTRTFAYDDSGQLREAS